ncbi:hypothetical protein BJV78DRAFT_762716 [Lactifluus subvellereus]|nr:hypothetical protein BJV78DRAFT_762716 [Lactifluus subvellereus]
MRSPAKCSYPRLPCSHLCRFGVELSALSATLPIAYLTTHRVADCRKYCNFGFPTCLSKISPLCLYASGVSTGTLARSIEDPKTSMTLLELRFQGWRSEFRPYIFIVLVASLVQLNFFLQFEFSNLLIQRRCMKSRHQFQRSGIYHRRRIVNVLYCRKTREGTVVRNEPYSPFLFVSVIASPRNRNSFLN